MKKWGMIGFGVHIILGLYFVNSAFEFVKIPEVFSSVDKWIIFIGGVLILFAGMTHLVKKGKRDKREF